MLCASKQPETGLSRAAVVQPMIGGSGARCNGDGVDGVDGPFGFLRSTPVEYVEVDTPLIVRQFRFVENSIAAGYHRGGAAIVIDVENRPWPGADVWRTSMNQVAMDVCHPSGFPDDRFNSMAFRKI